MSRWGLRPLLVLAVVCGVIALAPRAAHACTCLARDPHAGLADADAAVVATLLGREEPAPQRVAGGGAVLSGGQVVDWTFRVDSVIKGDVAERFVVESATSGASCGLGVRPGEQVGLFLTREGATWRSSLCQRFDPGELSGAPGRPPERADGLSGVGWLGVALILGAGAVAVAGAAMRRRREVSLGT